MYQINLFSTHFILLKDGKRSLEGNRGWVPHLLNVIFQRDSWVTVCFEGAEECVEVTPENRSSYGL